MLHGDHKIMLRNDLLVRDGAVMNRDGWDHVRVWYVTSCRESHVLFAVVERKCRNSWENDVGQSGKRVFCP